MTLRIKAPAKINWFLEVKGRRDDGYHEIETVMQAIGLFDDIEVSARDDDAVELTCNIDLGDPADNLAYRAAILLQREHAPGRGADITLHKRIPHGAGLGGGSSDASNTLVALDRLWGLSLGPGRLRELAGEIGSDCAFFIEGGTSLCTGRGERVAALPDIAGLSVVILYPEEVVSTPAVYAALKGHLTEAPRNCYLFHDLTVNVHAGRVAPLVANRLQGPALEVSGRLRAAWEATEGLEDVLVRFVSGSGSSIAFLMPGRDSAERLAEELHNRVAGRVFVTRTLPRGAVWG